MNKKGVIISLVVVLAVVAMIALIWYFGGKNKSEKEYIVIFDSNGGSVVLSKTVKSGEAITKPTDPVKDNAIFNGWYLNGVLYDFNSKVTKDLTLKAMWTDTDDTVAIVYYTVKFDNIFDNVIANQRIEKNGKVTAPTDPVRSGYTFDGWYVDDIEYDFDEKVTSDLTITAKWKEKSNTTPTNPVNATGITLNVTEGRLDIGGKVTLKATIAPANTTNKNVTWTSSNTAVATVTGGVVTAIAPGTATITAKTSNGKTATYIITVNDAYTYKISIIENELDQDRAVRVYKNGTEITSQVSLLKTSDGRTAANKVQADGYFKVNKNYLNIAHIVIDGVEYTATKVE